MTKQQRPKDTKAPKDAQAKIDTRQQRDLLADEALDKVVGGGPQPHMDKP